MAISILLDKELEYEGDPPKATITTAQRPKDITMEASHFHERQLQRSPKWNEWKQGKWKELNVMQVCKMFGSPVSRSDLSRGSEIYGVMQVVWSLLIKLYTRVNTSQVCGDGRSLRPEKKSMGKMHIDCTSMTGLRLLFAIAAYENRLMMARTDAVNANSQSGPLDMETYLVVEDAIQSGSMKFQEELATFTQQACFW